MVIANRDRHNGESIMPKGIPNKPKIKKKPPARSARTRPGASKTRKPRAAKK
jgi:hypothetical protein